MTLEQIQEQNPWPWRQIQEMNLIKIIDAKGQEVPLFHVTGLAIFASHQNFVKKAETT